MMLRPEEQFLKTILIEHHEYAFHLIPKVDFFLWNLLRIIIVIFLICLWIFENRKTLGDI